MSSTIIVFLAAWLGLNAAFVAIRLVAMRLSGTADHRSDAEPDLV